MPSVFERLKRALAPDIDLERTQASGGMGDVHVGRDTVLDRRIAVKSLKPELASAIAVERFDLEARSAARLSHPNVVRVYHSGIADGIPYFTMEYIAGPTLASRLQQGPLTATETASLGRGLLSALGAAHRLGIVHRDVKPSNVFLDDGDPKLGDFGIARVLEADAPTLTGTGQQIGTLLYMSPEQLAGRRVTATTDVYSTGLVLYEACTGQRWLPGTAPNRGDWSNVPLDLRQPLRKALQLEPEDRWPDAERFAAALPGEGIRWIPMVTAAVVAAAVVFLFVRYLGQSSPGTFRSDLALFPFQGESPVDATVSRSITRATEWYFRRLPNLQLAQRAAATHAWRSSRLEPVHRVGALTAAVGARYGAWAVIRPRGGLLDVEVSVSDAHGDPMLRVVVSGDSTDQLGLGDRIGARILAAIAKGLPSTFRRGGALVQVRPEAAVEFLQGEAAAERDAWLPAEQHYSNALKLDSTFVLAAWRLGNARRWMPLRSEPPFPTGFYELFQTRRSDLPEADQFLVEAQFARSGEPRFARYDEARRAAPDDSYAMLLYGDELFHRGPLVGRSLQEAARMLAAATAADPTLAPAWEHLAWALIRLGQGPAAANALASLTRVAGRREESEIYLPDFLRLAYLARFDTTAFAAAAGGLREPSSLALAARGALAFDLPDVERAFGARLASLDGAPSSLRASGRIAQGLALVALGRPVAALNEFDAAADLFPDPREARLQAAQWRVIPSALGFPGIPAAETDAGRRALATLAEQPAGARAAWSLVVDAFARGDTAGGRRWQETLARDDSAGGLLTQLADAVSAAARGDPSEALRRSDPVLAFDSAGYAPDPFFRAVVHLQRGDWQLAAGRPRDADGSWTWYENTDVVGWPAAEAQAGEVDWALSPWVRVRRARLAAGEGRMPDACLLDRRVLEIWSRPEPTITALSDSIRTATAACPP